MYYIYILYSAASNVYYVGHSDDPFRRLDEHNLSPHPTYTSKHRPWKAAAFFKVSENKRDAVRVENFIKKQKSRKLLEQMIKSELPFTGALSLLIRIPHMRS